MCNFRSTSECHKGLFDGQVQTKLKSYRFCLFLLLNLLALKRAVVNLFLKSEFDLSSFTTDSSRQLDVFRHDGHSLGVDGTQVCVFKQPNKVGFACFL